MAGNVPDADLLLSVLGTEAYMLWHRGLTHSALGLILFPPALAVLASGLLPPLGLGRALLLCELGFLSHVALDVPTSWGTLLLYPWSHHRVALDWVFITDPVLWLIPLGGVLLGIRRGERARRQIAAAAVLGIGVYVVAAGTIHGLAIAAAREASSEAAGAQTRQGLDPDVFPLPFAPLRWHGIAWRGESLVHVPLAGLPPRAGAAWSEAHGLGEPAVRATLLTRPGQAFLWWARVPAGRVVREEDGRTVVRLGDRRFAARGADVFGIEIGVGEEGEYLGAAWEGDSVFGSER